MDPPDQGSERVCGGFWTPKLTPKMTPFGPSFDPVLALFVPSFVPVIWWCGGVVVGYARMWYHLVVSGGGTWHVWWHLVVAGGTWHPVVAYAAPGGVCSLCRKGGFPLRRRPSAAYGCLLYQARRRACHQRDHRERAKSPPQAHTRHGPERPPEQHIPPGAAYTTTTGAIYTTTRVHITPPGTIHTTITYTYHYI